MSNIHKRDLFHMNQAQAQAGKEMWRKTQQEGRLAQSSFNAEENAPKTWILWANSKGEEIATIECEVYIVGRASDPSEGIGMLIAMCPKCGNHIHVREDNKTLFLQQRSYKKAPEFLRVNWRWHCMNVLGRPPSDDDLIPVVSSTERWMCDYCQEWSVKVYEGVAKTETTGKPIRVHSRPTESARDKGIKIEF